MCPQHQRLPDHKLLRPTWHPDAHSCGVSSCNNKMSSPSARERCLGRHEVVCASYHTRLIRITHKITNSREASQFACESCLGEQDLKESRRKDLFAEYRILKTLEKAQKTCSDDKIRSLLKRQEVFFKDLLTWLVGMERRADAELTKRRIGHQGWMLLTAPVNSRGLTQDERRELGEALSILDTPIGVRPSVSGVTMEDAKLYGKEYKIGEEGGDYQKVINQLVVTEVCSEFPISAAPGNEHII